MLAVLTILVCLDTSFVRIACNEFSSNVDLFRPLLEETLVVLVSDHLILPFWVVAYGRFDRSIDISDKCLVPPPALFLNFLDPPREDRETCFKNSRSKM